MEVFWRIKGRVQNVGFRRWAVAKAPEAGKLSGYVQNAENGDVLLAVSGDDNDIYKFMQACYKGPFFARVDEIEYSPELKNYFPPIVNGVFKRI